MRAGAMCIFCICRTGDCAASESEDRTPPYLVESVPNFYSVDSIKAIILAIACALVGALFCIVLHNGEHYLKKWFPNPYVRVVAGAAGVIILYFALRTDAYLGLGTGVIQQALKRRQDRRCSF